MLLVITGAVFLAIVWCVRKRRKRNGNPTSLEMQNYNPPPLVGDGDGNPPAGDGDDNPPPLVGDGDDNPPAGDGDDNPPPLVGDGDDNPPPLVGDRDDNPPALVGDGDDNPPPLVGDRDGNPPASGRPIAVVRPQVAEDPQEPELYYPIQEENPNFQDSTFLP